ncbi:MAG: helix-turn-helix transcriptional regulator [Coriobacteriia bacterium]|nr:helix-turn-helix transcriptional regulator [Coriobacteriia bacterium]
MAVDIVLSEGSPRDEFDTPTLSGVLGFALFVAWGASCVYGSLSMRGSIGEMYVGLFARAVAFGCAALVLFLATLCGDSFSRKLTSPSVAAMALVPQMALPIAAFATSVGTEVPLSLEIMSWAFFGISFAYATLSWARYFGRTKSRFLEEIVPLAVIASAFAIVGTAAMAPPVNFVVIMLMPFFSLGALFLTTSGFRQSDFTESPALTKQIPLWPQDIPIAVSGITLGFVCCLLSGFLVSHRFGFTISVATASIFSALIIIVERRIHSVSIYPETLLRMAFPFVISGILVTSLNIIYPNSYSTLVCLSLLFLVIVLVYAFDISNWNTLTKLTNHFSLSPYSFFGHGRIPMTLGQSLGWLLGALVFRSGTPDAELMSASSLLIVVALAIVITTQPRLPDKAYTIDDSCVEDSKKWNKHESGKWKQGCETAANRYGLSPRESEILYFLAKGRNAEYISQSLHLSYHTVKTHIYHIYQKMNLSSRQQLLDIIEAVDS